MAAKIYIQCVQYISSYVSKPGNATLNSKLSEIERERELGVNLVLKARSGGPLESSRGFQGVPSKMMVKTEIQLERSAKCGSGTRRGRQERRWESL